MDAGAGGTYRHFPSKRAILEAVIDATVEVPDDEVAPPDPALRRQRGPLRFSERASDLVLKLVAGAGFEPATFGL